MAKNSRLCPVPFPAPVLPLERRPIVPRYPPAFEPGEVSREGAWEREYPRAGPALGLRGPVGAARRPIVDVDAMEPFRP